MREIAVARTKFDRLAPVFAELPETDAALSEADASDAKEMRRFVEGQLKRGRPRSTCATVRDLSSSWPRSSGRKQMAVGHFDPLGRSPRNGCGPMRFCGHRESFRMDHRLAREIVLHLAVECFDFSTSRACSRRVVIQRGGRWRLTRFATVCFYNPLAPLTRLLHHVADGGNKAAMLNAGRCPTSAVRPVELFFQARRGFPNAPPREGSGRATPRSS
jgi:hypothetical protein